MLLVGCEEPMILCVPVPETSCHARIDVLRFDGDGWLGSTHIHVEHHQWGVVPDVPWIELRYEDGQIGFLQHKPIWKSEFVSEYSLDNDETRFVLHLDESYRVFCSVTELLEYVFNNVKGCSQFNTLEASFGMVEPHLSGQTLWVTYSYQLNGQLIYEESELLTIGWLSPRSEKSHLGKPRTKYDRRLSEAEWSVESRDSFKGDEPVNVIIEMLFLGGNHIEVPYDLPCYHNLDRPLMDVAPPRMFELLDTEYIKYELGRTTESGRVNRVQIGTVLNAPFIIGEGEFELVLIPFPTYSQIYTIAQGDKSYADEIQEIVHELYVSGP